MTGSDATSRQRRGRRLETVSAPETTTTSSGRTHVALSRSVDAVEIPAGTTTTLPAGMGVTITQTLGGNFTVAAGPYGMLYRIAAKDADALGREPPKAAAPVASAPAAAGPPADEKAVWDVLKTIFDPEIPVNVVDLGLVYAVRLVPIADGLRLEIDMTLTAPGCGMAGVLKTDVEAKLAALPAVKEVKVEIVWEPPWSREKMSEAAKLQLGML
jgi:probable FeS assembly SUF system protein SufT